MRHLDLFAGIGGFSLAASWVWGADHHIAAFCEKDAFCQRVLRKHWPDVPIVEDVHDLDRIVTYANCFTGEQTRPQLEGRRTLVEADKSITQSECLNRTSRTIDLLTAGFPCQPASCAGQRKGTEDDRWLWPQTIAAIKAVAPRYCILENVPGLLSLDDGVVFESVCTDLETAGYEVQPCILPACAVNAPHRRDRVWIVAYSVGGRSQGCVEVPSREEAMHGILKETDSDVTNSQKPELQRFRNTRSRRDGFADYSGDASDSCSNGQCRCEKQDQWAQQPGEQAPFRNDPERCDVRNEQWEEHWLSAVSRLCTMDDGLSRGLARPRGWRVNALRAAGNSIVPQVAAQIMRAIKAVDYGRL